MHASTRTHAHTRRPARTRVPAHSRLATIQTPRATESEDRRSHTQPRASPLTHSHQHAALILARPLAVLLHARHTLKLRRAVRAIGVGAHARGKGARRGGHACSCRRQRGVVDPRALSRRRRPTSTPRRPPRMPTAPPAKSTRSTARFRSVRPATPSSTPSALASSTTTTWAAGAMKRWASPLMPQATSTARRSWVPPS